MEPTQNNSPQQAPTQNIGDSTPKPKSKKKLIIISVVILLLSIVGILGFLLVNKDDTSNNAVTPNTNTQTEGVDVSTLTQELRQKYTEQLAEAGDLPGVSIGQIEERSTVGKPTGYNFYVLSSTGTKGFRLVDNEGGIDYTPEGEAKRYSAYQEISATIAPLMKDKGFTSETIVIPGDPEQLDNYIYTKSNTICSQNLYSFSCIEAKNLEDDAKRLDPFIELVKNTSDLTKPTVASISQGTITKDGANGYKIAAIYVSPERLNFYQTKSGEWKFVGAFGTQDIPECKEYGTDPEALKAFEGQDCYESLPSGQQNVTKLGQ